MTDTVQNAGAVERPSDFGADKKGKNKGSDGISVGRWLAEIKAYGKAFQRWQNRAKDIQKRYRSESDLDDTTTDIQGSRPGRFSVLWSNVQTMAPALYSRMPEPDVTRTFKDKDVAGRAAALILERATRHEVAEGLDEGMRAAVLDNLLTSRGTLWVRYVPTYGEETEDKIFLQSDVDEETKDVSYSMPNGDPLAADQKPQFDNGKPYVTDGEPYRPVVAECAEIDHVPWSEYGHTPAPNWNKVRAVWRRELLTREQLEDRFGDKGKECGLTQKVANVDDESITTFGDVFKRAEVFEIWDKTTRKVIWISPGYTQGPLDVQDDPLELDDFFPCPKPLYGTLTTDSLIPIPDYDEYKTQADEIDRLTERIRALTQAVRLVGLYDAQAGELQDALTGRDNRLIPVDQWAMFAEKGGAAGAISWVPIDLVIKAVEALTQIRTQLIEDLYQISGISDIIRGASKPSETLGAQRIKQQFAGMRLQDRQQAVAKLARDTVRIVAEIVARHFSAETLRDITDWDRSDEAKAHNDAVQSWQQKQADQLKAMMAAQMQPQGQMPPGGAAQPPQGVPGAAAVPPNQGVPQGGPITQPPMAPPSPAQPTPGQMQPQQQPPPMQPLPPRPPSADEVFQAAVQLLKDEHLRCYRIDIETDQMVLDDKQAEQQNRVQFIQAVSSFLQQAVPAGQMYPQLGPLLIGMLDWGIRGFSVGRDLEALFDEASDDFLAAHKAQPGQQPPMNPKMQRDQIMLQLAQMRLQGEQMKLSGPQGKQPSQPDPAEQQLKAAELQLRQQEMQLEYDKLNADVQGKKADTALKVAAHNKSVIDETMVNAGQTPQPGENPVLMALTQLGQLIATVAQGQQQMAASQQQVAASMAAMARAQTAPKRLVRDANGRAAGVETVPLQ